MSWTTIEQRGTTEATALHERYVLAVEEVDGATVVLRPHGSLTAQVRPELEQLLQRLVASGFTDVVLHLDAADRIVPCVVDVLVDARGVLGRQGARIAIAEPPGDGVLGGCATCPLVHPSRCHLTSVRG